MDYRIVIKEWTGFIPGYHHTYSAALKAAAELSIRVPNTVVSVYRFRTGSKTWVEECSYVNGL